MWTVIFLLIWIAEVKKNVVVAVGASSYSASKPSVSNVREPVSQFFQHPALALSGVPPLNLRPLVTNCRKLLNQCATNGCRKPMATNSIFPLVPSRLRCSANSSQVIVLSIVHSVVPKSDKTVLHCIKPEVKWKLLEFSIFLKLFSSLGNALGFTVVFYQQQIYILSFICRGSSLWVSEELVIRNSIVIVIIRSEQSA